MRNGGDRTTPTARLRARQTEQEVVELHLRGETWQKISDQLGMTRAGALKAWQRALRNMIPPEDRTAMRRVQAERLHRLRVPMFEILDSQTSEASDKIAAVRTLVRVDELSLQIPHLFRYSGNRYVISESIHCSSAARSSSVNRAPGWIMRYCHGGIAFWRNALSIH